MSLSIHGMTERVPKVGQNECFDIWVMILLIVVLGYEQIDKKYKQWDFVKFFKT